MFKKLFLEIEQPGAKHERSCLLLKVVLEVIHFEKYRAETSSILLSCGRNYKPRRSESRIG